MDRPSLYDDDIVTWAEEQAAALRALAERPELSNAVDWENVAEEIESKGRSHLRAVEGLLIQTLAHLLKRASAPLAPANLHWREEIATFQITAWNAYEASMRQRLNWSRIWKSAVTAAEAGLGAYGNALLPGLPEACPIRPEDLLTETFDIERALRTIATSVARR
ncbi:protein of unknown function DUF29 [Methylobacterium sp. UNC378MF]|uniref:DUF29 domain-containing protein n=1 Tax=Methylobacterium sp. UNC378MF TaxID=1502748 RepID=UPI00087F7DAB|nr:DUF29 domain-containing protein [Methylobacterium sp. UNC378MF]SDA25207.1 protein of unknown function DUF29 [Methylobacterium sp. UNC378MF]